MDRTILGRTLTHCILAACSVVALFPVYLMVSASFKSRSDYVQSPLSLPTRPNLDGYRTVLNEQLVRWAANSALLTFVAVVLTVVIAALAAWGFTRYSTGAGNAVLALIVALMVIPPVVLLVPLFQLGSDIGWISTYRLVILIYIGLMLPFTIFLLTSFFRTIPRSLLDAAMIDGASSLQTFLRIVVPLAAAPLMTVVVINTLWVWNELLIALVFLQDDNKKTLMVGLTGLHGRFTVNVPVIMAGLTVATIPIAVLYLLGQRFFVRGLVAGALRGE